MSASTLVHQSDEASFELLTLLSSALIAAGIQFRPCCAAFRQRANFGAVAGFGRFLPGTNNLKIGDLLQSGQKRLFLCVVDLLTACIVGAAFHVSDTKRRLHIPSQERDILIKQLLLQVLRAGRNDDAFA
jgi:hypothetical protein